MRKFDFDGLIRWYKKNGRQNLPRRNYNYDEKTLAYRVRLSEILLQQTQASRGCEYFEKIISAFPDIGSLASCEYQDFFVYYKGLGYYSRAKNMLKTAKIITEKYKGFFPKETNKLTQLPGIGPYTAQAIRAFAFDIKTLSFDTNLEKIFSRYYYANRFHKLITDEKNQILKDFLETDFSSRDVNNACMDFGAIVSVNNKNVIDFSNYPLVGDKFAMSKGKFEPEKKRIVSSFPADKAEIHVVLHENHRLYFSENDRFFSPFILPKTALKNKRSYIQKFFLEKYGLEVSVRPAHKKYQKNEKYFMEYNVQIQTGDHNFFVYQTRGKD